MDILQSKFTTSVTNAKKDKIWEEITEAVNAVDVTAKTTQEVRDKWKNLQSNEHLLKNGEKGDFAESYSEDPLQGAGLCSKSARVPQVTNFCLWATR